LTNGPKGSGEVVDDSSGTCVEQFTPIFKPEHDLQSAKKTMPTVGSAQIRSGRITKTLQKTSSVELIGSSRKEEEIATNRDTLTERHYYPQADKGVKRNQLFKAYPPAETSKFGGQEQIQSHQSNKSSFLDISDA